MNRTRFEASIDKARNVEKEEQSGNIADSRAVRLALMKRVHEGEITLEAAQKELKKIQSTAKRNGKLTRSQAFNQG